jgi:hypothetical protein
MEKGSITLKLEDWWFIQDQLERVMDFEDTTEDQVKKQKLRDKILKLINKLENKNA